MLGSLKMCWGSGIIIFKLPLLNTKGSLKRKTEGGGLVFNARLKPLTTLQPMERWRFADILLTSQTLLNTPFGNKPSPFHAGFQAAFIARLKAA